LTESTKGKFSFLDFSFHPKKEKTERAGFSRHAS
jgi:hypothetical protein